MAEIKMPFNPMYREWLLYNRKTATTRFKKYGNPGDTFKAFGAEFELLDVRHTTWCAVLNNEYQAEGFSTPAAFREVWEDIHPGRKGRDSMADVWFHVFRRLPAVSHD